MCVHRFIMSSPENIISAFLISVIFFLVFNMQTAFVCRPLGETALP